MIDIQHISKQYKSVRAISDIALRFNAGQSVALIGPNGSGKSTLMKCILGLAKPTSGNIYVQQKNISGSELYRTDIGYMPQIIRFPEHMLVSQLFFMMRDLRRHTNDLDNELFEAYHIRDMFAKPLGGLSGGMKQKVNAALAFMFNPKILILDEPTAGLDPLSAELLKAKIRKEKSKGKLIIISSHIMADLEEIATDVLFLIEGRIAFYKTLEDLKRETSSNNLGRSIASYMAEQKISI
ncbi:MAG TPA: ABC transporter ATP-binding protein [Chitinophagales bacterium]|nr:ABC transporter ATP-binding protein [Chitinophagales bacterium]